MKYLDYQSIALGISVISLVLVVIRLYLISKQIKADHERRCKQSTLEMLTEKSAVFLPIQRRLTEVFGLDDSIPSKGLEIQIESELVKLLHIVETISVGINTGIYDLSILNRTYGDYFIRLYDKLQPYIAASRIDGLESYYAEFERMVTTIKVLRSKKNNSGVIKHSQS